MRRLYFGLFGLALLTIVAIGAYDWDWPAGSQTGSVSADAECAPGTATDVQIGGPFELVNQDGETVTEADFQDKYMLVYFGFTFCPDTCPIALETMSVALEQAGEAADAIVPVFISVDPERDTPDVVKDYISYFHNDFVGLTGSMEQVKDAARAYRVYFGKEAPDPASDSYFVNHTSIIYLMGPGGRYLTHFTHSDTPQKIASQISSCIRQK